jgi:hypothetical protein
MKLFDQEEWNETGDNTFPNEGNNKVTFSEVP